MFTTYDNTPQIISKCLEHSLPNLKRKTYLNSSFKLSNDFKKINICYCE